jgi:hypothetical protein
LCLAHIATAWASVTRTFIAREMGATSALGVVVI